MKKTQFILSSTGLLLIARGLIIQNSALTGIWQDLNWLGGQDPNPGPTLSIGLRVLCCDPVGAVVVIGLVILLFKSLSKQHQNDLFGIFSFHEAEEANRKHAEKVLGRPVKIL